jgi:hypothetical protein
MKLKSTLTLVIICAFIGGFAQNLKTAIKNGQSLFTNKKYQEAEAAFTEALTYDAKNTEAHLLRGT